MDGLISRQAAIAEIARWIGYIDEDMILRIQAGLKKLMRNVQTNCRVGGVHSLTHSALVEGANRMDDVISKQAAIDAVQSRGEVTVYANR